MKKLLILLFVLASLTSSAQVILLNKKGNSEPYLSAGADLTITTLDSFLVSARTRNLDSLVWRTDGTGTFTDSTAKSTYYTPSLEDYQKDSVVLSIVGYALNGQDTLYNQMVIFDSIPISIYTISGGGEFCDINDGLNITLSSSDANIQYRLYNSNTATDSIKYGESDLLTFYANNDTGYYKINCVDTITMDSVFTDSVYLTKCPILNYNPIAWYDASDDDYIVLTTTVDSVMDKSGNGNTLHRVTQLTGGPTLTNDQFVFTRGSGKYLYRSTFTQGTLAQPNTIFYLCQYTDSINTQYSLAGRNAAGRNDFDITSGTPATWRTYAGTSISHSITPNKQLQLHTGIFNGATSDYYINGSKSSGSNGDQPMIGITLGAGFANANSADVKINEVIVYDAGLTIQQIEEITTQLQEKWGLTGITYASYKTYTDDMAAYMHGDTLYTSSPTGDNKTDLVTYFYETPCNGIHNVIKEGYNNNTSIIIDTTFAIDTLLMWARSDNIGPYINKEVGGSVSGWSGGAHLKITGIKCKILYFNYLTGKMKVSDPTYFPDALNHINVTEAATGNSRGYFSYTGKTSDTLTGVALATAYPVYIQNNDTVILCQKTVKNSSVTYTYNNGISMPETNTVLCDSVTATVVDSIYGYWTINDTTGLGVVKIVENRVCKLREKGQWEVRVISKFLGDITITMYYGLQRVLSANTFEDNLYMAKAENSTIRTYSPYLNSGAYPTYLSDRAIFSGVGTNHSWWLDLTYGLPTDGYGFTNYIIGGSGKYYYHQINQSTNFENGDSIYWRGGAGYFRNNLATNSSYAYFQHEAGKLYLYVDFHSAVSETITSSYLTGKTVSVKEKSASVTATDLNPAGGLASSCSTTYGYVKYLIE